MKHVERTEVLPIGDYEQIRPHFRARIIEEKRPRRARVGEHLTFVFENHDSVLLQIQEMLRTERITSEPAVMHEIETYNELVPGDSELSFTLFVEIPERELRDQMLVDLAGLEDHVFIEVDGERYAARGKRPEAEASRTTAVHYLKVALSPAAVGALKARTNAAAIVVTHPKYTARTELGAATVSKLAEDLMG
jgi:hypothetical protein